MASQTPVQISTFQYWMWRLRHLPNSILLTLNVFFIAVIVLFWTKPIYIPEWYPGGVKTYPTIQIVSPTLAPLPTIPEPPTMLSASQEPPAEPEPVVGVFVPQEPVAAAAEPLPTIEIQPTPEPTVNQQATVDAWLAAPPSTTTPSPTPGDPGFAESFQPEPECNLFIGYVGEKRNYCNGVYATQTAEAQP